MNDAAQIRSCTGALCARHSLLQAANVKISNREKSQAFQIAINPSASAAHNRTHLHSQIPNFQPPHKAKSTKNLPQSSFRLERTRVLHFQQLTGNLNEPMFRLEIKKGGKKTRGITAHEAPREHKHPEKAWPVARALRSDDASPKQNADTSRLNSCLRD